jgi:hypothetical protein
VLHSKEHRITLSFHMPNGLQIFEHFANKNRLPCGTGRKRAWVQKVLGTNGHGIIFSFHMLNSLQIFVNILLFYSLFYNRIATCFEVPLSTTEILRILLFSALKN